MKEVNVVVDTSGGVQGLKNFFDMLANQAGTCFDIGKEIAALCDVPYQRIGPDPERLHWPDSYNDAFEAAKQITKLARIYWHGPSLNLVLVDESGKKIGIRSTSLSTFGISNRKAVEDLTENLVSRFGKGA